MIHLHHKKWIASFYLFFGIRMATKLSNCMTHAHHKHVSLFSIYLL